MTDALQSELLDLLDAAPGGYRIRDLMLAVPAATLNQLTAALVELEESGRIEMTSDGHYIRSHRKPGKVDAKRSSYLEQRTRKGGVMTTEGFVPYFPHPSGWMLPVKVNEDGRPHRRNRRLVYVCPDGTEYQPHDQRSLDHRMRQGG